MASSLKPPPAINPSLPWHITSRLGEYEGEARVNFLRLLAICSLYSVHLLNYFFFSTPELGLQNFHRMISLIAGLGVVFAATSSVMLTKQFFPAWLKYFMTLGDLALITIAASIPYGQGAQPEGANSPLVLAYFLVIAMTSMRLSLGLVWFATLGSMACYYALVGMVDKTWFDADHAVAPVRQLFTVICLGSVGVIIGQGVRRTRAIAEDFVKRTQASQKNTASSTSTGDAK